MLKNYPERLILLIIELLGLFFPERNVRSNSRTAPSLISMSAFSALARGRPPVASGWMEAKHLYVPLGELKLRLSSPNNDRRSQRVDDAQRGQRRRDFETRSSARRASRRDARERLICKSAQKRRWLRAERHEQVIRKWNTYRSRPRRIGDGDRWIAGGLASRDRPLGDWPLSGVSITTSSSPAAREGGSYFSPRISTRPSLSPSAPSAHARARVSVPQPVTCPPLSLLSPSSSSSSPSIYARRFSRLPCAKRRRVYVTRAKEKKSSRRREPTEKSEA